MELKDLYATNKLLKHLDRLSFFEKQGFTWPILADFDLTNRCNNKCISCCSRNDRNSITVSFEDAKNVISQLHDIGVRAIEFEGGGEPSCHPNLEEILRFTEEKNIDVAINTNGYELSDSLIETMVTHCTWGRVSLDADGPEIYKRTHGMDEDAFNQVVENISKLVKSKEKFKSDIIIGTTYLLGPRTINGVFNAAKLSKDIGVSYMRFRPFEGLRSFTEKEKKEMFEEFEKCEILNDEKFVASYRKDRCESVIGDRERPYEQCLVPHVVTIVTPDLKVYPCCVLRNNKKYVLGDLTKQSFEEIWLSEKRKKVHEIIDLNDCPNPCQFEKYQGTLYTIKNQVMHENFL